MKLRLGILTEQGEGPWELVPFFRSSLIYLFIYLFIYLIRSHRHAAALLKNRLYRRWGIKTALEYARIKIDGLRLVGGNPDFTNAPGHGDDDARFYDRQHWQAYVHARGG